jgi:chromosome segregation ATPase
MTSGPAIEWANCGDSTNGCYTHIDTSIVLGNSDEFLIRYFVNLTEASPGLKTKLKTALGLKGEWDAVQREMNQVNGDLQRLNADQDRIRKNLRETPSEAAVYATYLKKLSDQEKEIDGLTAKQKALMSDDFQARKKYEEYLTNISD